MRIRRHIYILTLLLLVGLLTTACGGLLGGGGKSKGTIRIGSKEFTEQHILGNMYKYLLEDAGYTVEYTPVGGTVENHEAITSDQIDIYPEYTGTALLTILKEEYDPSMGAQGVYELVKQQYKEQFDLVLLEPTSFNNTYCLTMPEEKAQEMGIDTVSDLTARADELVFGTTQEFTERPDGLPGLKKTYGGFQFREVRALDPGLLYSGIDEGQIDVTTCFGTDGQIAALGLTVLEDDKDFWPPYPVAPVVRAETLEEHPEIADILNQLAPLLDQETMQTLNWQVAGQGEEADTVARTFLEEQGLIGGGE